MRYKTYGESCRWHYGRALTGRKRAAEFCGRGETLSNR